jgi:hypothetical protein
MPSLPVHKLCPLALLSARYLCVMTSSDMCFTPHISHGDHDQSKSETLYETCKPSHACTLLARPSRRPRSSLAINER